MVGSPLFLALTVILAGAESRPFALQQLVYDGHHSCVVFSKLVTTSQSNMYAYMTLTRKCFRLMVHIFLDWLEIGLSRVVSIDVLANTPAGHVYSSSLLPASLDDVCTYTCLGLVWSSNCLIAGNCSLLLDLIWVLHLQIKSDIAL